MVLITIVTGSYKPTYNWGAPHCKQVDPRLDNWYQFTMGAIGLIHRTTELVFLTLSLLVDGIPTPLKNDGVKVRWDDSSQQNGKINNMLQTTNQTRFNHDFHRVYKPCYKPTLELTMCLFMGLCEWRMMVKSPVFGGWIHMCQDNEGSFYIGMFDSWRVVIVMILINER